MSRSGDPLGVTICHNTLQVVVALQGELDRVNVSELGRLLDAIVAAGHRVVVLDLAELDLMNSSGLRVISERSLRLQQSGGRLTIRSPSSVVRRILEVTDLAPRFAIEACDRRMAPLPGRTGFDECSRVVTSRLRSGHHPARTVRCAAHRRARDIVAAARREGPLSP